MREISPMVFRAALGANLLFPSFFEAMRLRNRFLSVFLFLFCGIVAGLCLSNLAALIASGAGSQRPAPCVFDNFAWFSEQEIIAEIRKDLPSFNGTIIDSGDSVRKILAALERLLKSKQLPSEVGYNFYTDGGNQDRQEHVFTASNARLFVCNVAFTEVASVPEVELQASVKPLLNRRLSKIEARTLAETTLLPVYRKFGYLQAIARMPGAALDPSCKLGAGITMKIEPGIAYIWDKVVWQGNKALSTQMLDSALAMRSGDVANGLKIDAGLAAVVRAYGRQGYAGMQLQPVPDFNQATRRVLLNIAVNEGVQYRMGNLSVVGLSESSSRMFKELWQLKTGDLYDATYLGEFMNRLIEVGGIPADQRYKIRSAVKTNNQKQTVDVVIDFNAKP